jgi:hypothetical protein
MQAIICQEYQLWALVPAKLHEPEVHGWETNPSALLAEHGRASVPLL